jgi:hypothetical protein
MMILILINSLMHFELSPETSYKSVYLSMSMKYRINENIFPVQKQIN